MNKLNKWQNLYSTFVSKYFFLFVTSIVFQVLFYLMGVARPYVYKVVIDSIVHHNFTLLKIGVIGYSLVQIFTLTFLLVQRFFRYKLDLNVMKDINLALFRKSLTSDYFHLLKFPTGQMMQRFSDDVDRALPLVGQIPADLIGRMVFFAGILIVMLKMSITLSIIPLVFMIIYIFGYRKYSKTIPEITQIRQESYSNYLKELEEGLNLGYMSRIHNAWNNLLMKFEEAINDYIKTHFRFAMLNAFYQGIVTNGIYLLTIVAVLIGGSLMANKGLITVGTLVAFVSYTGYLYDFISFLTTFNTIVEPAFVSVDRINEILSWEEKFIPQGKGHIELDFNERNAIEIRRLNFELNGKRIFSNLTMDIENGKITAIFGRSGGGKTSLINLFLKIYDPPEKTIFVFGRDLVEIPIGEIYEIFSVVEQEPSFFTGSIKENILFGSNKSWEDVIKIAQILGLEGFLRDILEKERGAKLKDLSGGERKRLGLLRGLLNPKHIVLLDEPTAFLDESTSENVLSGIVNLLKGKTIVIFTHDPLVTRFTDRIVHLSGNF